ncbi:hypothetical protein BH11VER1_BH11VER1_18780 [soil metagenome]
MNTYRNTFLGSLAALGVCMIAGGVSCFAAETILQVKTPLSDREGYQAALRASKEGIHDVAALKFERLLKDEQLTQVEIASVSERMVDALIRSREANKALVALTLFAVPESAYWKAQVFILQGKLREAEWELKSYLAAPGRYAANAKLSLGQTLIAQDRENTGRKEFKELLNYPDPEIARLARLYSYESEIIVHRSSEVMKRLGGDRSHDASLEFVKGCGWLELGEGKKAESIFKRILNSQPPPSMVLHSAATVRLAEAYVKQGRNRYAEKILIQFLGEPTGSPHYEQAFDILNEVSKEEDEDTAITKFGEWAAMTTPSDRNALALFYLGQWLLSQGRGEHAVGFLETFCTLHPTHPRNGEALRLLMSQYGAMRADERVLELTHTWKQRFGVGEDDATDYLTGMIRFSRSEYQEAVTLFERSAKTATDAFQQQRAIYNMAVAAFFGEDKIRFQQCLAQLNNPPGTDAPPPNDSSNQAARLLLEQALNLATSKDSEAETILQEFLKLYSDHPRAVEAHLALAELYLLDVPARTKAAQEALKKANLLPGLSDVWKEKLDYTALWSREADGDLEGVVNEGTNYLGHWKQSIRRDEVRMKVAQSYYRLENYAKAEAQFEALEDEQPESAYAEVALFFAGKSAMALITPEGLEKAISLWEDVVARNGPLMREARRQQALAKRRQGNERDALGAIETLLNSVPQPEGDEKLAFLMEKGELLSLMVKRDPKHLDAAIQIFYGMLHDAAAPRVWRSRSGYLLSQLYALDGKNVEALEACNDVVEDCFLAIAQSAALTPQEYLWLYRSGFAAIEMLETKQQWEAAARLADRLAGAGGERSEEAKLRATRLRLEHFLWDK